MNDDFLCVGYALGHTCGVKVQKVQRVQKIQRVVVAAEAADYKKSRPAPPSFRPKRSGVEKSPPLMVQATLGREISRLRVSSERLPSAPYRHAAPLEMTKEPRHPTIMLKKGMRLAPESLAVRMQKKRSPSFRGASFFISAEIRIHSSGIRMPRHRSRYRCLWSLRRSCIRRGVLRS